MKISNFHVNISPEMQLYKILQRQSYDIGTALAEFVDNSVQSFSERRDAITAIERSEANLKVRILISSREKRIVVEDNAGGINRRNFQQAIRMGHDHQTNPNPESLSVYGIGMKSSAIWFSNKWSIETSALGSSERLKTTFDLDQLLNSGSSTIEVTVNSEDINKHYTRIIIDDCLRGLDDQNNYFRDSVLPYLQETFFKFQNVYIELVHDNLLQKSDKAYLTEPSPLVFPRVDNNGDKLSDDLVTWKRKLDFTHESKRVKGHIMIMDTGSYHGPGIRLLRNRRVIHGTQGGGRQNKPHVLLGTANKYAPQRIYGEITLNEFPVNFMKTGFDVNMNSLYRAIKSQISARPPDVLEDFVQQATWFRKNKATSTGRSKHSTKQKRVDKIPFSENLRNQLSELEFNKLYRLYESLCEISLSNFPILAYVGAWSLLESLATNLGKKSKTAFNSFYNGDMLNNSPFDSMKRNEIRNVINDIHGKGNMNKHSESYETINAQQLASDFPTIKEFLLYCADQALNKKT